MQNFFQLFDLPIDLDIDMESLSHKRNQLHKQHHPDMQVTEMDDVSPSSSKKASESLLEEKLSSAIINHAYQTLLSVDSRAEHLLSIQGQTIDTNASIADLDFLDHAMDIRIQLDDAVVQHNDESLHTLKCDTQSLINKQAQQFKACYVNQDWTGCSAHIQKLKFLVKIDNSITQGIDEIAHKHNNNDDDLYV